MCGLRSQRGQATVEWVGLLLGVALMLGALVAGGREAAKGESAHGLGDALAERVTCTARGACAGGVAVRGPGGAAPHTAPPVVAPRPGPALGARGVPPLRRLAGHRGLALRAAGRALEHAWIVCLGYRRWRYDVEHPPSPREAVPVKDTLDMVNECVNPLSFLFG